MDRFKLVRIIQGSGWPSGHIAIDRSFTWPEKPGGNEQCLTLDAESYDEFSGKVDELIAELEAIRKSARLKFEKWQAEWRANELAKLERRKTRR